MKLRPLNDRVIVKRKEPGRVTPGGLHLPDSVVEKEKPREGTVIAVGPGCLLRDEDGSIKHEGLRVPPQVKVGDVVVFSAYGGYDATIDGEDFLILSEGEILGVKE
jgi:chaperonin GroES